MTNEVSINKNRLLCIDNSFDFDRIDDMSNTYQQQWELDNKERRRLYKHNRYIENKDEIRAKNNAWKLANKERSKFLDRRSFLKTHYHITPEQYNEMVTAQQNNCLLCHKPLDTTINNPIDHDHKCCLGERTCGKCIRGILHDKCNRYIALIEKYPELLPEALKYIKLTQ